MPKVENASAYRFLFGSAQTPGRAVVTQEDRMSEPKSKLSRRTVFAGAGTLGALATAAAVLPAAKNAAPVVAEVKPEPESNGGYRLTAHVQRYYQTTKV